MGLSGALQGLKGFRRRKRPTPFPLPVHTRGGDSGPHPGLSREERERGRAPSRKNARQPEKDAKPRRMRLIRTRLTWYAYLLERVLHLHHQPPGQHHPLSARRAAAELCRRQPASERAGRRDDGDRALHRTGGRRPRPALDLPDRRGRLHRRPAGDLRGPRRRLSASPAARSSDLPAECCRASSADCWPTCIAARAITHSPSAAPSPTPAPSPQTSRPALPPASHSAGAGRCCSASPAACCWPPFSAATRSRRRPAACGERASACPRRALRFWSCSVSAWRWR